MSTRSPARLIVALAVAAVLAVFLLYTAVAGHSTPTLTPSELGGKTGQLSVVGKVVANRLIVRDGGHFDAEVNIGPDVHVAADPRSADAELDAAN